MKCTKVKFTIEQCEVVNSVVVYFVKCTWEQRPVLLGQKVIRCHIGVYGPTVQAILVWGSIDLIIIDAHGHFGLS